MRTNIRNVKLRTDGLKAELAVKFGGTCPGIAPEQIHVGCLRLIDAGVNESAAESATLLLGSDSHAAKLQSVALGLLRQGADIQRGDADENSRLEYAQVPRRWGVVARKEGHWQRATGAQNTTAERHCGLSRD